MVFIVRPYQYYAALPDSTLINRVREENWNLDKLFPLLKETKKRLKRLKKDLKSSLGNTLELKHCIILLGAEIRTGVKDLKLINFYDSAILYLYYKMLHHIFELCEKEHSKLTDEKEKAFSNEIKLKEHALKDIKKAKDEVEKKIKIYEKSIKELEIGENELIEVYEKLVEDLEEERWDAEKLAQHEVRWREFTFRSMENLNRKIKVMALMAKKKIPEKQSLQGKINEEMASGEIKSKSIASLAKLVSKSIDNISRDVAYSSKLVSKFEKEMEKLKSIVENLKNTINNSVKNKEKKDKIIKGVFEPWDRAIKYFEDKINEDLMENFRNIFGLYKKVGTRRLKAA